MARKIALIIKDFARQMSRQNISAFASSTAFFVFLSLIPMLILICTMIPYTMITEENLVMAITQITPDSMNSLLISVISEVYDRSAGILSIAAVATIWSAGKGVLALIRGLNAVNGVVEDRNYFLLRLVASFYTLIFMVAMLLSLVVMVFGNVIVGMILMNLPPLAPVFDLFFHLRFLFVWAVLILLFTLVYSYVPNKKQKLTEQIPGAIFAAISWSLFSWGFSLYVDTYEGAITYGSLSIIILIMLWLYFGVYIIMIGAHLNRYLSPVYRLIFAKKKQKES